MVRWLRSAVWALLQCASKEEVSRLRSRLAALDECIECIDREIDDLETGVDKELKALRARLGEWEAEEAEHRGR